MTAQMIDHRCRVCGGFLDSVLDLGPIVPSTFLAPHAPDPPALPLNLCRCRTCNLVQLHDTADPESLYREYWYRSGVNETMRAELFDLVQAASDRVGGVQPTDLVVDVGANDGTLLSAYAGVRPFRIAFEPARNLYARLRPHCEALVANFFPSPQAALSPRSVTIITAIAMFYDLDHPREFVAEVDRVLADDGVWVVQFQDLQQMLDATGYDNICHEHLCYYSLGTFMALLSDYDLGVVHAVRRSINGGSLRLFVQRTAKVTDTTAVDTLLKKEAGLDLLALEQFCWRVHEQQRQLTGLVRHLLDHDQAIDLYAASTKSATLLQACGLDHRQLRCAVERTWEKVGLVTSATRIPIIGETQWRQDPAPYALVGAYQFRQAFLDRESAYLECGGRFILPLPAVEVICGMPALRV